MCGIAGFFGNYSGELLEHAGRAIAHRGPDADGARELPVHALDGHVRQRVLAEDRAAVEVHLGGRASEVHRPSGGTSCYRAAENFERPRCALL